MGELTDTCDGRYFEVTKMARQENQSFTLFTGADGRLDIFQTNQLLALPLRHQRETKELDREAYVMGVVGLCKPLDLLGRQHIPEDSPKIAEDHGTSVRPEVVE